MKNVDQSSIGGQHLASSSSSLPPYEGEDQTDEGPSPQLAIRSDGAVLLSIEDLGKLDLSRYTVWTAIVVPAEEAMFARERGADVAQEIAAKLAGRLLKKRDDSSS